jgi:hypothetical protein
MKHNSFNKNLIIFSFFLFVLFFFSTSFKPYDQSYSSFLDLKWEDTYTDVLNRVSGRDDASYIEIGKGLLDSGFRTSYINLLELWPIGLPSLHSLFLSVFGLQGKPIQYFYYLALICWSLVFTIFYNLSLSIKDTRKKLIALILLGYLLISDLLNIFFLKQAILLSESISTSLFLIALVYIYRSLIQENIASIFCASFLLVFASLTRVTIDFFVSLFFFFLILYFIHHIFRKNKSKNNYSYNKYSYFKKPIFAILIFYEFLLLPYRLFLYNNFGHLSLNNPSYVYSQNWMPDFFLRNQGGGWLVDGGSTVPCKVEPQKCEYFYSEELKTSHPYQNTNKYSLYKWMTVKTIILHPIMWARSKFDLFVKYWFSFPPDIAGSNRRSFFNSISFISFFLITFYLIYPFYLSVKKLAISNKEKISVCILPISIIGAFIFPQFLTHFEVRYFYPAKLIVIFLTIILLPHIKICVKNN